jgi:hypothetical protein
MLRIDCDTCVARDSRACDDCLVTFLLDRPEGAIVFDVEEERALRLLEEGGLAPHGPQPRASRARGGVAVLHGPLDVFGE